MAQVDSCRGRDYSSYTVEYSNYSSIVLINACVVEALSIHSFAAKKVLDPSDPTAKKVLEQSDPAAKKVLEQSDPTAKKVLEQSDPTAKKVLEQSDPRSGHHYSSHS